MGDAAEPVLQPGSVFAGRYQILRLLGEGERKRTYLAEDTMVPRRVAIALIRPGAAAADPEGTRREAAALAQAGTHDSVVTFHDWGIVGGAEYLVFDYLAGGTLREFVAKRYSQGRRLSAEEVMLLGRQLARALVHVHKLGLVHRDVAPGNVWLDERGAAHLGDFDSAVAPGAALDPAGLPPTTEAYAAPEQVTRGVFDERSDLYSLGAVLFEALTGECPQREPGATIAGPLRTLRPDIPRGLCETVSWLLSESPGDRPADAEEVLEALKPGRVYRTVDEGLVPWADTLPFPLASILWRYEGEPDPSSKVDCLLKFFEALAQFTATVLISVGIRDEQLLLEHKREWFAYDKRNLSRLRLPTFGTWVHLTKMIAQSIRTFLGREDGSDRCSELFAASNIELLDALVSVELDSILSHALDRRNKWSGHGGIAGERIQHERLGDLQKLLRRTQASLSWSFEPWMLLKPGGMILSRGVFDLTATILKGPNPAFRKKQVQVSEPLDTSRLYLLYNGSTRALGLVPFIRVHTSASGQEACYFYNRLEANAVRWISYHFQTEPELCVPDDELVDLLVKLTPRKILERRAAETASVPVPG